jgi:hypothetical protein
MCDLNDMTIELIEQAARGVDVAARLEGPNRLMLIDVIVPDDASDELRPYMRAAANLHLRIQSEDDVADVEETLEDALRSADSHLIDEGCELYRALLASRLKDIFAGPEGPERILALANGEARTV